MLWFFLSSAPAILLTLRLDEHGKNYFAECKVFLLWFFSEEITRWWCLVSWRMRLATFWARTMMVTKQGKETSQTLLALLNISFHIHYWNLVFVTNTCNHHPQHHTSDIFLCGGCHFCLILSSICSRNPKSIYYGKEVPCPSFKNLMSPAVGM